MTIIYILLAAVVLVAVIIYLLSATLHIAKIIKELEAISKEQSQQNEDIRQLMIMYINVVGVLDNLDKKDKIQKAKSTISWNIEKGEAQIKMVKNINIDSQKQLILIQIREMTRDMILRRNCDEEIVNVVNLLYSPTNIEEAVLYSMCILEAKYAVLNQPGKIILLHLHHK